MSESQLGTYVTYNPLTVSVETTIDRLLQLVEQLHMHHFPVAGDDGRLVGVVSDTDIWQALHRRSPGDQQPVRAQSLVSRDLVTIDDHATPRQALELLLKHSIHSLPVLEEGRLVGIVTSSDYLREFSYGELAISRDSIATHLRQTTDTVDADAALEQASQQMEETQRPHLAVLQGGCPVGLVSLADLGRSRLAQPSPSGRQTVSAIMRRTPPLRPGQRLSEAASLMVEHHLPAVVVTNQANRFLGILADSDILALMLKQLK